MQLTQAIDSDDRTLHLDGAYSAAARLSYLEIDDEVVMVTRGDGTDTLKVARGQAGTTAAAHDDGATVTPVGGAAGPHNHSGVYLEPSI